MEAAGIVCTHPSLREVNFGDRFAFICNGCREMGYETCYTCSNASCNYYLHSACKTAAPTMSHPFFANQGIFVLEKAVLAPPPPPPSPYSSYNPHQGLLENCICVACGTSVAYGWRYVLSVNGERTNVFLHPCCMEIPHQNLVQPKLENHINCVQCRGNHSVMGWAYIFNDGAAMVHVKCMQVWRYRDWERRNYNNNVPNHGYTTTQERGLGGRRSGGIVLGVLDKLVGILGFANDMGLFN